MPEDDVPWDFVWQSLYMHKTVIGYTAAFMAVVLSTFDLLGQWTDVVAVIVATVGIGWMGVLSTVIMAVPFSNGITQKNWKIFMEEEEKLKWGRELNPERVDEIETTVEKNGLPFTTTITFVVMLFVSDMQKSWKLRTVNRTVAVGITLIGSVALMMTGNVAFAVMWFFYHFMTDAVLFRAVSKVHLIRNATA